MSSTSALRGFKNNVSTGSSLRIDYLRPDMLQRVTNQFILITLALVALYYGQHLIVPFFIALVVWYLINSVADLFGRLRVNKKSMPRWIQLFLSLVLLVVISTVVIDLVVSNFEVFALTYPKYQQNFNQMTGALSQTLGINLLKTDYLNSVNLPSLLGSALDSSLGFLSTFFLVLLYVIFLLLEQRIFQTKLKLIFKERREYVQFLGISKKVDESVHSYVSIKTALCLAAGILSYLVLIIIGVDFAFLWSFLIFLLNFIPIIGAFIGVVFPSLIALVQFGGVLEPVLVLSLLTGIQLVIGNLIEPKVLGTRLNLSPLVVIISLSFWGALWGIAGMFLCVPITVILMIILGQFESTKRISILLSAGKDTSLKS